MKYDSKSNLCECVLVSRANNAHATRRYSLLHENGGLDDLWTNLQIRHIRAVISLLEVSMKIDQWLHSARAGSLEYINMIG